MDWLGTILPFVGQYNQQETSKQLTREARQWEEDMYNKYNSPAALVRQYKEAGLNPALMFGQPAVPAPTQTTPAETAPSSVGSVVDMLGQLIELDLLDANKRNIEADTRSKIAGAVGQETENEFKPEILRQSIEKGKLDITQAQNAISRFEDELANLRADTRSKSAQATLAAAQSMLAIAQKALVGKQGEQIDLANAQTRFEQGFQEQFGFLPNQPIWNQVSGMLGKLATEAGSGMDKYDEQLKSLGKNAGELIWNNIKKVPENVRNNFGWLNYFMNY